ncbi:DNA-processing protein DprA [Achromobacter xylosoxidans]|uniref:DNA-processing protein DprA n=1 Tax=Alcaligenes xylosoxydans xylosoxydans TaxID=85698 RepID=UPI00359C4A9B
MLKGVGPAALRKAVRKPAFHQLDLTDLARDIPQISRAIKEKGSWETAQSAAKEQLDKANHYDVRILSPLDSDYPALLAGTSDDPLIIYVRGALHTNPEKSVAIIGTREPTEHGKKIAERVTHFFASHGWSIVSGLALGCDAIAHRAALEMGAHTVAVLAHGLHTVAPARHKRLAEEIIHSGGALISEYPFGQGIQKQQYVKRDRTQAGLAQGVVMIQSDHDGGSLHASRAALDYKRWLAVPFPTAKDLETGEAKIRANLTIANGSDSERATLLRCSTAALKHVVVLRGRDDYFRLESLMSGKPQNIEAAPPRSDDLLQANDLQLETSSTEFSPPRPPLKFSAVHARRQHISLSGALCSRPSGYSSRPPAIHS